MDRSKYSLGFTSQEQEYKLDDLEVFGTLPEWLSGTLIRTAPGKFEVGEDKYQHWFDGLCMLHQFTFEGPRVSYQGKFLDSGTYRANMDKGRIVYGEFGTDPCRDLFQKASSFFTGPIPTDNGGVNVNRIGNSMVSCTETPLPVVINPQTLEAQGQFQYKDSVAGQITPAHPHYSEDGTLYSFVTHLAPKCHYHVYRQRKGSATREILASIPVTKPAYMHSLGMSEQYILLTAFPMVTEALKFRFTQKAFIEKYSWQPELGTSVYLVHKETGEVHTFETEAFFGFHHVNAFEQNGEVVFDILAYQDAQVIEDLYLQKLRSGGSQSVAGELWRFRLSLADSSVKKEVLITTSMELPRINYERVNGKPYQYVYAAGSKVPGNFLDSLVKGDVINQTAKVWDAPNCYPGEAIFVARPGGEAEDDGVLLSIVLDVKAQHSFLLVLDAQSLHERARVQVPHPITFGFHGQYLPKEGHTLV